LQEFPSRSGGGLNRLKLLVLLGCLALALWGLALPAAADDWQVTAESFVIMDAKTGRILLSLKPHKLLQPASTIKIMTAMYVRERLNLHDRVRVSRYAASAPPSKVGLKPGPEKCTPSRSSSTPCCCPPPMTGRGPWPNG